MAEKLPKFPIKPSEGRHTIYPWDQWLDGHIWKLIQGEDFKPPIKNFRNMVYTRAKVDGKQAHCQQGPGYLVIQAKPRR